MPTKVHLVKAMVFPIVMYGCESWTIRKAERWRTDASELWCWRRLLRVLWTARRSNQSILKEISPGCSMEGLMLKLKLQYFGHLMRRTNSLEKTLMLGKIKGRRRRGCKGWDGWMASPTQWTWVWVSSGSWWWTGKPGVLQSMVHKELDWLTEMKQKVWLDCDPFITTATLVQDGGTEGCGLISCKSIKIAATCWTTIGRRMLEPTRKRYPMSKDKGEAAARL